MNAPSQTAVIHKSSEANLSLSATLFVWVCAKSRKKKKKEKKKKKSKEKKEREKNTQNQLPRFELALHRHLLAWVAETLTRSQANKI